jgi:type 1 glutamine amidotransferase
MMKAIHILLVSLILSVPAIDAGAQKKIRTMIATGQDGSHWWEGGCDAVRQILENTGLFTVEIIKTPARGGDMTLYKPDFSKYDLVVINYGGATWPEETREKFEKFVAGGGGVVVIHSSVIPMADWPEYNRMTGLGAWDGRDEKYGPYVYWADGKFVHDYSPGWAGHHALQRHSTIEHRNTEHPVTKGLNPVWRHFKDEIYSKLRGPAQNMEILATTWDDTKDGGSGRHEPMMWTVKYGKGKIFVTLLGHAGNDPELRYSMECTGFQETLSRGSEWAATGAVTRKAPDDFPTEHVYTLRPEFKPASR